MLKLNSSRVLEAVLAGAVATVQPAAVVGYNDKASTGFDGDSQLEDLNDTTAVAICAAPASGAIRHIDYLTVRNYDSAQVVVTVRVNESGTLHNIIQATLETGEMLGFTHAQGWYVNTADGSRKSGAVQDISGKQDISEKNASNGYVGLLGYGIVVKDAATGLVVSLIDSLATLSRGYYLPDKSGTFAMVSDVDTAKADAEAYADSAVAALVNASPTTLDTLKELADALGDDANFAATTATALGLKEASANKNASGGYAGLTLFKLNLVNALGTITSWFTTAATVARTWTMPDKDGTVAMTSDVTDAALSTTDITTNNASTAKHGFLKKLSNTANEFMNGVGNWVAAAALATANTFTAAQRGSISTLTDASTVALDLSLANQYALVLGGSRTLGTPTNIVAGQQGTISVRQDATGSRTLAYAWPYVWAGGTAGVLSTPGCTRDLLGYSVDAYNSAVVTITIATPGVVSMTAHGFASGQRVQITTTGALPTGLTASTTYFVSVVDADSFKLCTTLVNAAAGTFINTSGSQSGVHTLVGCTISMNLSKAFA